MRIAAWACLGGQEIANDARAFAYIANVGLPNITLGTDCACFAYDEGYISPLIDPAPWYEPTRPESADFLGFVMNPTTLGDVFGRTVKQSGNVGGFLSPLRPKSRNILFSGSMFSTSAEGMAYGERWLTEALRGSPCETCAGDELIILPACPEEESYDSDRYFRTLVDVGLTDGPVFSQRNNLPECFIQQVSFTLTASKPWLYLPRNRVIDNEFLAASYGEPLAAALTTPEWMGEGTFVIDITSVDPLDISDIVITGRISLDGTCPVSGLGTSVPPSFVYTIPTLAPEDRIVIDGRKRSALYYDASAKVASSALPYMEWDNAFPWPEVGPCTTMCLTIESASGEALVTVDTYLKEL